MLPSPRDLRSVVKRLVGWNAAPRGPRRWLRELLLRDLDVGLRYGPALGAARRAAQVLEVGSGPYGIAPFVRRPVVGADLSFAGPRHPLLHPVTASGTALPFQDRAFEVVICFDVLEHVPPEDRVKVAAELGRVCRGQLFIAVPFGAAAAEADAEAAEAWMRRYGTPHPWLHEHVERGLPAAEDLAAIAEAVGDTPAERRPYTWLRLWWLARREETSLRPDLVLLRRLLLPPLVPWLWKLSRGPAYRILLRFDLVRRAVAAPPRPEVASLRA